MIEYEVSIKEDRADEYQRNWSNFARWPYSFEVSSEVDNPVDEAWSRLESIPIGDRGNGFESVPIFTKDWIEVTLVAN